MKLYVPKTLSNLEIKSFFSLTEHKSIVAKRSIVARNMSCCRNPKVESEIRLTSTFRNLRARQLIQAKLDVLDFAFLLRNRDDGK